MTDSILKNIFFSTKEEIVVAGQYKKFSEYAESYANNKGMSHVANCINEWTDKHDKCFESEKVDLSNCVQYMDT